MAGSVRQKAPGKWEVRAWLPKSWDGSPRKQVSRTVEASSRRAAEKEAALLVAAIERGEYDHLVTQDASEGLIEPLTVAVVLERWLEWRRPDLAANTIHGYAKHMEHHILPALGDVLAEKLSVRELDSFYASLTPNVARKCHSILRSAFRLAVRWELLERDIIHLAERPSVPKPNKSIPTDAELGKLFEACDLQKKVLLVVASTTGARRGELCALRWQDIDLEASTVTIRHSCQEDRTLKSTKTSNVRTIPLDPYTAQMLKKHYLRASERALKAGKKLSGESYCFSPKMDYSVPYRPNSITLWFWRLCQEAGIGRAGLSIHSLRHYVGTHLIGDGTDPKTAANRLGHSRPTTTLAFYTHTTGAGDVAASDRLGKRLEALTHHVQEG